MSLLKIATLVAMMVPVVAEPGLNVVQQNESSNEKADIQLLREWDDAVRKWDEFEENFETGDTEFVEALEDERETAAEKIQEFVRAYQAQKNEKGALMEKNEKAATPTPDELFAEYDTPAPPTKTERLWGKARNATGFLSKLRSLPSQMAQKASEKRRSVQRSTLESMKALKDGSVKWTKSTVGKGFTLIVGETGDRKYVRAICFVGATSCAVFGPAATGQALLGSVNLTWSLVKGTYTVGDFVANAPYWVYDYSNYIVGSAGYLAGLTQRSRARKYANQISQAFSKVKQYVQNNPVTTVCVSVPVIQAGATCLAYAPSGALLGTVATVGSAVSLVTPFLPVLTGLSLGAGLDRWLAKLSANAVVKATKKVATAAGRFLRKQADEKRQAFRNKWQKVGTKIRAAAAIGNLQKVKRG